MNEILTQDWRVLAGVSVLVLIVLALVIRKTVKRLRGTPADVALGKAVMWVGLLWSSEAMWELATDEKKLDLPTPLAVLLFTIFEAALVLTTLRAERSLRENGWPGRYGRTAWGLAVGMGVVAAASADSFAEVVVRIAIPLTVTKLWWDGMVGETAKPEAEESSWTLTPTKVLVFLRLRKPGRESLEQVNRGWLIERMTKLEFALRFGPEGKRDKVRIKLARLAIKADQTVLDAVLARVSLADNYLSSGVPTRVPGVVPQPVPAVPEDSVPVSPAPVLNDVPAAQDTSEATDEDLEDMVTSYARRVDPDTGRLYSVRKIGDILGINKNKVTELKRRAKDKLDNEAIDLTPGFFDYQKEQQPELEGANA